MEKPFPGKVAKHALALGLLYLLQQVQKKSVETQITFWARETRNVKRGT